MPVYFPSMSWPKDNWLQNKTINNSIKKQKVIIIEKKGTWSLETHGGSGIIPLVHYLIVQNTTGKAGT